MSKFEIPKHYIIPKREIKQISRGLVNYNTVLLVGTPGIGKTMLAKYYGKSNPLNFKEVHYFGAFELAVDKKIISFIELGIADFIAGASNANDRLVIIDGFDEIASSETKRSIIRLAKEGKKYGTKTLVTSRPFNIDSALVSNSLQLTLKGWSKAQVVDLLKESFSPQPLSAEVASQFMAIAEKVENNPWLLSFLIGFLENRSVAPKDLFEFFNKQLLYKNEVIELVSNRNIILPEKLKLITDISLINTSLIEKANRNPQSIYQMTSRQFEELVAELFDREGYNVTLTQETKDGGKDLIIIEHKRIGNFIIYVECKKYSEDFPVGVRLVRELYGSVMADRATAGVLVTSSYFSNPAIQYSEQIKSQLSLIDYCKLKKWIDDSAKGNH